MNTPSTCQAIDEAIRRIDQVIESGPFDPSLSSLEKHGVPDWYLNGKFGIFIHWAPNSVPAYGSEWYPSHMYQPGSPAYEHHLKTYGPHKDFGYKDFIPQFKGERFDAGALADLFKRAGAKYVVPSAEHHDGFAMYASKLNRWNAKDMGPKRDVAGEYAAAVRDRGMVFGLSSHRAEHYWFYKYGLTFDSDVNDPEYLDLYGPFADGPAGFPIEEFSNYHAQNPSQAILDDWLAKTCEFVDLYKPQLVWFDWWVNQMAFRPYFRKFAAYYYNRGEQWGLPVAINYKDYALSPRAAVLDIERGQMDDIFPCLWQNDTSAAKNSWGYTTNQDWKTADWILGDLIDVVSKNGALLLNVGPKSDGTLPQQEVDLLKTIGDWMEIHGQAIYGTRPWTVFGEGPTKVAKGKFSDTDRQGFTPSDIRFTCTDDALYALPLVRPTDGIVRIHTLAEKARHSPPNIRSVELLGHGPVPWTQNQHYMTIQLPPDPNADMPCAIKLHL